MPQPAIIEDYAMKHILITIAIVSAMTAAAGTACAAEQQALATVSVQDSSRRALDCTPPNDSPDCTALHAQIRANFSPSEISMLFGAATSSPEYPTAYARVDARYKTFLHDYEASKGIAVVAVGKNRHAVIRRAPARLVRPAEKSPAPAGFFFACNCRRDFRNLISTPTTLSGADPQDTGDTAMPVYDFDFNKSCTNLDMSAARSGIFTPNLTSLELHEHELHRFNDLARRLAPGQQPFTLDQIAGAARRVLRAAAKGQIPHLSKCACAAPVKCAPPTRTSDGGWRRR